ncbi:HPr family phosphocarrier protein [Planococcus sp. N028]|uniref:Phosphocarrier protein HPr n=1 Tax=Planococcus shixiaomingii TaxID=3058393 RepID=A0ABT8N4Y1_9BACL|nr:MULTISPECIES: HPr family phosphocarrier protein [unclassified Planococcus (in: firmicutes)]MDN7242951.1 HPr family phosphocarrier protein [Planococcus sp. N028]WKA55424.1 HPr family phosphocarrier protein [Planococcus sp. N022]
MIEKSYKITSPEGLHARPASALVAAVSPFSADVKLGYKEKQVNMKSIMGVMSLGIAMGGEILVSADGSDEESLMAKVDEVLVSQNIAQ